MPDATINDNPNASVESSPVPTETSSIDPIPESTPEVMLEQEPTFILKDINGGVFRIPNTLPWGKEKKILSIVGRAFKELMPKKKDGDKSTSFDAVHFMNYINKNFNFSDETLKSFEEAAKAYSSERTLDTKINAEELLQFFAIQAPGIITTLISVITGKSEADIDDQYAGDSVLAFAIPYVIHSMQKYAGSFMGNF